MKKILSTLLSVLFCAITFAQSVPQGINYQAVARDASGAVLMNQALTIQFSVISDITTSAVSWQETHQDTTNDYGLYTSIIGQGTSTSVGSSAAFDSINWGASNHLLKVEVDFGGGIFVDMGTTAFMSVPYSIYSVNPGPPGPPGPPGTNGIDGIDGIDGAQGPIGFDGNSSMWKWTNANLGFMVPGSFNTLLGGPWSVPTNSSDKETTTSIRIRIDDDVAVTPELEQWLLFCDVGSILYIRRVDKVQEVAYYQVTNVTMFGTSIVRYLVTYIDGDGTPAAGITDENTYISNAQYYIGYIPAYTLPAANAFTYSIGDTAQGGIVFYVSPDGKNGLVAATVDQSTSSNWYKASDVISNPLNHTSEGQKFRDWRLPTKYELNIMYQQLYIQGLGGLTNLTYWTSAELNSLNAGNQDFGNGIQGSGNKDANYSNVRAVRAF